MHLILRPFLIACALVPTARAAAQTFQNGDLTGSVSNYSELPPQ
jgi:hypothetical protein